MEDNIFKTVCAGVTAFISYCVFSIKKTSNKIDYHDKQLKEHDTKLAVIDNQMTHILDKLTDVVDLGADLKKSNNTILRALARKSKSQ